jgi:type VI protein secretion system component VasF
LNRRRGRAAGREREQVAVAPDHRYRRDLVGTAKRERQKANRAMKQAAEAKAAKTSAVKRNVIRWVIVGVAAFGAVLLIAWVGGAFNGDDTPDVVTPLPVATAPATVPASAPATATSAVPAASIAP